MPLSTRRTFFISSILVVLLSLQVDAFGFGGYPSHHRRGFGGVGGAFNPYRAQQPRHQQAFPTGYHARNSSPRQVSRHQPQHQHPYAQQGVTNRGFGNHDVYNQHRKQTVAPRQYKVQELQDRYEIHVESTERYKGDEFQVTLDERSHELRIQDRSRGFDESWTVPESVLKRDIRLSDSRIRNALTVIVPKHGSNIGREAQQWEAAEPSPGEHWSAEQRNFKEERPWDFEQEGTPTSSGVKPQALRVVSSPSVIDSELDVRDITFPTPVMKSPNAVSGYTNMQGDFVSY